MFFSYFYSQVRTTGLQQIPRIYVLIYSRDCCNKSHKYKYLWGCCNYCSPATTTNKDNQLITVLRTQSAEQTLFKKPAVLLRSDIFHLNPNFSGMIVRHNSELKPRVSLKEVCKVLNIFWISICIII